MTTGRMVSHEVVRKLILTGVTCMPPLSMHEWFHRAQSTVPKGFLVLSRISIPACTGHHSWYSLLPRDRGMQLDALPNRHGYLVVTLHAHVRWLLTCVGCILCHFGVQGLGTAAATQYSRNAALAAYNFACSTENPIPTDGCREDLIVRFIVQQPLHHMWH
jgi:hypothetical protein